MPGTPLPQRLKQEGLQEQEQDHLTPKQLDSGLNCPLCLLTNTSGFLKSKQQTPFLSLSENGSKINASQAPQKP